MSPVIRVTQPPTRVICEGLFRGGWDIERSPHRSQVKRWMLEFQIELQYAEMMRMISFLLKLERVDVKWPDVMCTFLHLTLQ